MESYTSFAQVYDEFMDQTPYDQWLCNILGTFKKYGIEEGSHVLELGCGTGKMTRRLRESGYRLTAVDNAIEMLEIAKNIHVDDILYILQDMTQLNLPEKADAVVSICDCMNYILESEDMLEIFLKVRKYLNVAGVFMFDMNSRYKYEKILAQNTFAEDREEASFIWDNFYDPGDRINEYQLSLFIKNKMGTYDKFEEIHYQKAYEADEIYDLLKEAGFEEIQVLDTETMEKPKKDTERLYFIAR